MNRWWRWVPLLVVALLLGVLLRQLEAPRDQTVPSAWVDRPMPAFALPAATAGVEGLSSRDLATGTPHLVNVFASWCVPCQVEAPQLEAIRAKGIDVVGIAIRDTPDDLAGFLFEHGNPFSRIGSDRDGVVQISMGSSGVPESFLVDGRGIVREQIQGVILAKDVDRVVARLKAMR